MPSLARTLLFAAAFASAAFLGRLSVLDGSDLALVWPAAGVALLWLLVQDARPVSVDVGALAAISFAVNLFTGASILLASLFVVVNVIQVLVVVTLLRRTCAHLWGCGGSEPLASTRDLSRFVLSCLVGTGAGMALGIGGIALLTGEFSLEIALAWWGRNLCGAVLIGAVGLLTGHRFKGRVGSPIRSWRERVGETLALVAVTVVLSDAAFLHSELPLAFPLLIATVWAGLRFSTLFVAWHTLCSATAGVVFTLLDLGPFARVVDQGLATLLAQVFVILIALTGLAIGVGRDERARLAADLSMARDLAAGQATLMRTMVQAMGDGLLVVDDDGMVVLQNPAVQRLFGFDGDVGLEQLREVVSRADGSPLEPEERLIARAIRGEDIAGTDLTVRHPDGSQRDLRVSATHLAAVGPGAVPRAVLVFHDVTEDREQREDLKAFAGVVAHDILNPLTSLTGWAHELRDELEDGLLDATSSAKMVDRILASSERMRTLVDDLLANATAEDRTLQLEPISLTSLVDDIVQARDLVGGVLYDELGDATADAVLVRQLFDNLIGNSVKYVAPGTRPRIEIVTETCEQRVQVCLSDNGIGIPPAERERIFERFHRAHAKDYPGTGLGLHICRRTVERHGGTIAVRDNPAGQGSVFEFSLPAGR